MKLTFAHLADVHLGNTQYGLTERFDDFGRAWLDAIRQVIEHRVTFVVIAGDLFEKRTVEPLALMQAQEGLRLLKLAGIPVVAVEGNHDRALYREGYSWMEYLDAQGELILLNPYTPPATGCHYQSYRRGNGGSYIDIAGVRIVGQPYLGASAARTLEDMSAHLRLDGQGDSQHVVYLCHAGLEGIVPRAPGCLTDKEFACIRPSVDYMALGHVHRQFQHEGWLFNPGALETCRSDEADFESGFFIVEVDTDAPVKHQVTLVSNWRRPFIRLSFSLDQYENPAALSAGIESFLHTEAGQRQVSDPPLLEIKLTGCLAFDAMLLDLDAIKETARISFNALYVAVKDMSQRTDGSVAISELETRDMIEHRVFQEIFAQDAGYAPMSEQWVRLAKILKNDALSGCSASELVKGLTDGADALGLLPQLPQAQQSTHHAMENTNRATL